VLRFQRYGGEWSLRQVVFAGLVRVLPGPKSKIKEIANRASSDPAVLEIALVALNRQSSSEAGVN